MSLRRAQHAWRGMRNTGLVADALRTIPKDLLLRVGRIQLCGLADIRFWSERPRIVPLSSDELAAASAFGGFMFCSFSRRDCIAKP